MTTGILAGAELPATRPRLAEMVTASVLLVLGLAVGLRDFGVGTDTYNYIFAYQKLQLCRCMEFAFEPGFEAIGWSLAIAGASPQAYLVAIAMLQLVLLWMVSGWVGGTDVDERERFKVRASILLFFLLSPLFLSAQINAMRQGTAAIAVLFACAHLYERRYRAFAAWAVLSVLLHYSSILYVATLALLLLPPVFAYLAFALSFVLYLTGVTEQAIHWLSTALGLGVYELVKLYAATVDYQTGIRYDFAIASALFLFAGVALRAIARKELRPRIDFFLKAYACLMLPFLWLGWAVFSNRFAYTPWLIMSCVIGIGIFPRLHRLAPSVFAAFVVAAGALYLVRLWSFG